MAKKPELPTVCAADAIHALKNYHEAVYGLIVDLNAVELLSLKGKTSTEIWNHVDAALQEFEMRTRPAESA